MTEGGLYNLKTGVATADDLVGLEKITVTADLSSATWNTVAAHEIAVVSGCVHVAIVARCTTTGDDTSGNTATIALGVAGSTSAMIAAGDVDDLLAGELWYDATPTTIVEAYATAKLDFIVNGVDIGFTIAGEAATAGVLVFEIFWEPISDGASVAAGLGGSFA